MRAENEYWERRRKLEVERERLLPRHPDPELWARKVRDMWRRARVTPSVLNDESIDSAIVEMLVQQILTQTSYEGAVPGRQHT
jgi:hypothetical protein